MSDKHESAAITYSTLQSIHARSELFERLNSYSASPEETERSLGLFIRGSLLARFLAIEDIYKKIVPLPGIIMDIGTWRGQTAVLCENFRAIFEPLHLNRRIVCFDTFTGYEGFSEKDRTTQFHKDGTYQVGGSEYAEYLNSLLVLHEKNNAMGHNSGKHRVITGDCRKTIPAFFSAYENEFVALAFFDLNALEPTRHAVEQVHERLVPGGILAFWQMTRDTIPAEGSVYTRDILGKFKYEIARCETYPGLCYLTKTKEL